jgi:putative tricarboxylic transport membrane protein
MLSHPDAILLILLGSAIGLFFGVLPGLGGINAVALCLAITYGWDPMLAMFFFAALMGSSSEGGSVPAILVNTPGTPVNATSCLDGYPMTQRGEAGRALGLSAGACLFGALFGVAVLIAVLPLTKHFILSFGPVELFWLAVFGLVAVSVAAGGAFAKSVGIAGFGVLISLIGYNATFGVRRFTGGSTYLEDGLPLIPFFVGLFAISEMLFLLQRHTIALTTVTRPGFRQVFDGFIETFRYPVCLLRSAAIGAFIGLIPGVGGGTAMILSYTTAVNLSKNPDSFGKGNPEGIVASDAAIDAKDGGALFPTAAFGIPGSAEFAVLLGALLIHGLTPGPMLIIGHMNIVWALILGLVSSNIIACLFLLFLAGSMAKITRIKAPYIAGSIILLALVGAYGINRNIWDVLLTILTGVFGYLARRGGFSIIPLVVGFVLGNLLEESFFEAVMVGFGNYSIMFTRPIGLGVIVLTLVTAVVGIKRSRGQTAQIGPEI